MTAPDPSRLSPDSIVAFLADIFARRGGEEYLGEPVTMAEHMLQGAHLAEREGADDMIVAAALLHDIGHFTSEFGTFAMADTVDRRHEDAAVRLLAPFFPAAVVEAVGGHVAAKRYLCATEPAYLAELSPASRHSLALQGGPMSADEVRDFARTPNLETMLRVRRLDDAGKVAGMATPAFDHYALLLQRLVDAHCGRAGTAD
jgi:phosphonate degradation associated HDIG domain protein